MSALVLDVDRVSKLYRMGEIEVRALDCVSLTVARGDFVAVMGSSGSGKSTLMNILGLLDQPTSGRYVIDGVDASDLDDDAGADLRNRMIGFVFQSFNLVPKTTALANVELPMLYAGISGERRRARALAALQAIGLGDRVDHVPSELSGGEQQRVAVARALVMSPTLLLADEPTGNLDSHSTLEMLRLFDHLNATGRTIVLITHEPDVAGRAKRVIRLIDGRIVEDERQAPLEGLPPGLRVDRAEVLQ